MEMWLQRASLRHASTAYCLAFFSLFISCGPLRNKVWGWRISLSRCTYLISVLPALLLLRFIDQDDCILCPLLCKSGRGKGSFAEMWVLRAGACLSMHSQLASSLWCSVIKIIKWVPLLILFRNSKGVFSLFSHYLGNQRVKMRRNPGNL